MTHVQRAATLAAVASALVVSLAWADIAAPRRAALSNLLVQDCGSCHGLTMRGGLGPALTPEALAGKPPVMLRDVILHGRPGTPMPPWQPFLTVEEAEWLVQVLINGLVP
ncbi:MAG: cytochrome c [Pseudomonadota bacterium]|nr:MAG: cytochrome c [Pseudomonadota bacterium]